MTSKRNCLISFSSQGPETALDKLKSYTTSREVSMKSWIMEKLEEERRFNRRESDLLKSEVLHKLQQTQLSRWTAVETSWSALNERGSSEVRERLREVERELANLRNVRRIDEVDRMAERIAKMERQMAKMEEEHAQERKETAERESERKRAMEEEKVRERRELEDERARERREMERRISQMEEERAREKREMERMVQQMEEWRVERERMKRRQAAMERVVEDIEAWFRKRDDSVLLRTEVAITQMEDRFDQIEDSLASLREDSQLKNELETFVSDIQKLYSKKFQETADHIDKSFKKLSDRCILKRTQAMVQQDQGDQQRERLSVDRGNVHRAEVRGGKRRRARRRQDREEHSRSSTERRERESPRKWAQVEASETSSTSSAKAGWTSDEGPSETVSELSVITEGKEKIEKRGFFSKLFKKNKGKKA
ncbi:trichohyalin-like isoform X1 [Alosa sapidissima]|uniref:trichohyalin-like isoform X1 n=1 Tax=Alosa sapidissima TaxID=34773 RepID=UPI001C08210E|nr:trichohyalin-like isoform X1 [Alosa sapidissima]